MVFVHVKTITKVTLLILDLTDSYLAQLVATLSYFRRLALSLLPGLSATPRYPWDSFSPGLTLQSRLFLPLHPHFSLLHWAIPAICSICQMFT